MNDHPLATPPARGSIMRWPTRTDFRHLVDLAVPVVVVQLGLMLMGVVDIMMVGHYSALDLAATALGNLYSFGTMVFGMGMLLALDPLVAQAIGASDIVAARRAVQRGIVLAVLVSMPIMLVALPAPWVLPILGQPAEISPLAAGYAQIVAMGVIPFMVFVAQRQSLQAMKMLRPVVLTIALSNVLNVALNWVFVFGNLGAPTSGTIGVAAATLIARWAMCLGLFAIAWKALKPYLLPFERDALRSGPLIRTIRLGLPIGAQFMLEFGIFALIALLMGRLGTIPIAAHQVAINIASVTFMVPLGVSSAAGVLVGHAVGRGDADEARRSASAAIVLGTGFMALSGLTLYLVPRLLASAYSSDIEVITLATVLIPIAGFFQVWDGLQVVALGILRGVGDTRTPMIVNIVGFWLLGLPASLWLAFGLGLGAIGLWWGMVVGLFVVAVVLAARVRTRLAGELRRLEIEDAPRTG